MEDSIQIINDNSRNFPKDKIKEIYKQFAHDGDKLHYT